MASVIELWKPKESLGRTLSILKCVCTHFVQSESCYHLFKPHSKKKNLKKNERYIGSHAQLIDQSTGATKVTSFPAHMTI